MSAKLFNQFNLPQADIAKLIKLLSIFKHANKDAALDEEDMAMEIVKNYYGPRSPHIKNFVGHSAACGYYTITKQWKKKYERPSDFTFINFQQTEHFTREKFQHMLSTIKIRKDHEAFSYIKMTQELLQGDVKVTKVLIRKKMGISWRKQENIIKRIKHYYG